MKKEIFEMRVGYGAGDIKTFYRNFIIALWKRFYVIYLWSSWLRPWNDKLDRTLRYLDQFMWLRANKNNPIRTNKEYCFLFEMRLSCYQNSIQPWCNISKGTCFAFKVDSPPTSPWLFITKTCKHINQIYTDLKIHFTMLLLTLCWFFTILLL